MEQYLLQMSKLAESISLKSDLKLDSCGILKREIVCHAIVNVEADCKKTKLVYGL